MFSFYNKLLAERNKIAPHHWVKTYGWVIKTIDNDIATQFPADLVEAAKSKARADNLIPPGRVSGAAL
ncbi:hypothetical protein ID004_29220 [Pseudomonas aeruginosa]|nr:hypothetical protein [Pseudomonas aeruginosa]